MPRYFLSAHAYACLSGEQLVLLDLKADRYFALELGQAIALAPLVHGWPVPAEDDGRGDEALARELLSRSLLTFDERAGKDSGTALIEPAALELTLEAGKPAAALKRSGAVLLATARAAVLVRWAALARIVGRVGRRKRRCAGDGSPGMDETRELVAVFEYLRPYLFSARNACFLDCLALIEFLALHGIFPTWVFGVRTRPFAAHCWLQRDGIVLNDSAGRTGSYTAIMSV